jgi:hypothetical protein
LLFQRGLATEKMEGVQLPAGRERLPGGDGEMRLELGNLLICSEWIPQKARGKNNGEATRLDIVYGFILALPRCVFY